MPRVSILLPNLNNRSFFTERLATIQSQAFSDWELIVSDSFSDDGAWDFFRNAARHDQRIKPAQAPRDGMYANWNRCLERVTGEFVYFATSDDTMAPDFLTKMVSALDAHPDCEIAQCCLNAIDAKGTVIPDWWRLTGLACFLGDDYLRPHLRRAPYDGVLHCAMHTIYHSITQILVRRSAFDKTGPFPVSYGPGGDFCWGMKAGLHCSVVHVPEFLATWRIHSLQASASYQKTATERALMVRMVDDALAARRPGFAAAKLPARPLCFPYRFDYYRLAYAEAATTSAKLRVVNKLVTSEPAVAWGVLRLALAGKRRRFDKRRYVRQLLRRFHLESSFVPLGGIDRVGSSP